MQTAACYIRVSTDDQTEYSPDSQLKLIRDYAAKNNICLLEDYIFTEDGGKSGKNMSKRTEFMRLISITKQKIKPFDLILVWKFSRFARNQEESIVIKSMLKKKGIEVISISESIPEGPFGDLIERIIEWSDEYYLTNLSEEVKRGMKERAGRGKPVVPPPFGYDMVDGNYVPNDNSAYVKNIFNDYLNGLGFKTIAIKYGNMGMRTKRGNLPDNRYIEYMLRNPVYIGKLRWTTQGQSVSKRQYDNPDILIIEGTHKPIVDETLFDAVQDKIKRQKMAYGKYQRVEQPDVYPLKGLVRCSSCGATLVRVSKSTCPSLQCHNYNRGTCKTSHFISMAKAEKAIIDYLKNALALDNFKLEPKNTTAIPISKDYAILLENEQKRLERCKQAYQAGIDTLEEYKANKEQIQRFIEKIKKEAAEAAPIKQKQINRTAFKKKLKNVINILSDPKQDGVSKNKALRTVISSIIFVKSENRLEVEFYE